MNKIKNISMKTVQDYSSADTLSGSLFVFDGSSEGMAGFNRMVVTDFPVRLEIDFTVLCLEGSLRIHIGCSEYVICKNDFIIILSHKVFQITEISPDFKAKVICIRKGFLDFDHDQHSFNVQNLLKEYPCQSLPAPKIEVFSSVFDYVQNSIGDKENMYRKQIVYNCLNILFYELCNLLLNERDKKKAATPNEKLVKQFMRDLDVYCRKERTVEFYADRICLTPKYFSRVLFQSTGKHAKKWIDEYVVLEAKAMLKSTYLSIQQISYELHFATPSHFGRYFKTHTGISPGQYREKQFRTPAR